MRKRIGLILRILGTAAGIVWIALAVNIPDAVHALAAIPVWRHLVAFALVALNVVLGAVRWQQVMRAYGATNIPTLRRLNYLYFVAFFYNTYLPGAITGDVGRGVVTHDAFPDVGATGAIAVVLIERVLGLFALFVLVVVGLVGAGHTVSTRSLWIWTSLGLAGSCALVAAIPLARRLAPYLPAPIAKYAARLPQFQNGRAFTAAIGLSLITQLLVAFAGWITLAAVGDVTIGSSLVVVPIASATAFLPITVGGTGAREAVYVALCAKLFGMAKPAALAASLSLWLSHLAVGAVGAIAQLVARPKPPQ